MERQPPRSFPPRRYREPRPQGRRSHMERVYALWSPVYDLVFAGIVRRGHRKAFEFLDPRPGESILEVGVGTGLTLPHYPAETRVVGIDISDKMLRRARSRAERLSDVQVTLETGDASALRFADDSFDGVLAAYVLTAVEDPYKVCMEIRRVLKPGGRLVTVCNSNSQGWFGRMWRRLIAPLAWRFGFTTVLDVPDLLVRCGYQIQRNVLLEPLKTHRVVEGTIP